MSTFHRLFGGRALSGTLHRLFGPQAKHGGGGHLPTDRDYLIHDGRLINATFKRASAVVYDGQTFAVDEPATKNNVYAHNGQITPSIPAYNIDPFGRPAGAYLTAASAADPNKNGANWAMADNPWCEDLLKGPDAHGTLFLRNLVVFPTTAEWVTSGDRLDLLAMADGSTFVFIGDDGYVRATDGTNIAESSHQYNPHSFNTIAVVFGESKMQLYLNLIPGDVVPFTGSFNTGATIKYATGVEDIMQIGDIYGRKTYKFSESQFLAADLAFNL